MHIEAFHSDLYKIKFLISKKPHQNVLGEINTQIYISFVFIKLLENPPNIGDDENKWNRYVVNAHKFNKRSV